MDECNFLLSLKFDFFRSLEVFHFASSPRQSLSSFPIAFSVLRTAFKPVDFGSIGCCVSYRGIEAENYGLEIGGAFLLVCGIRGREFGLK